MAERLGQEVVLCRGEILAEEDSDTLMSMAKLSTARMGLGKYATSDKEMTKAHTTLVRGPAETALHYDGDYDTTC